MLSSIPPHNRGSTVRISGGVCAPPPPRSLSAPSALPLPSSPLPWSQSPLHRPPPHYRSLNVQMASSTSLSPASSPALLLPDGSPHGRSINTTTPLPQIEAKRSSVNLEAIVADIDISGALNSCPRLQRSPSGRVRRTSVSEQIHHMLDHEVRAATAAHENDQHSKARRRASLKRVDVPGRLEENSDQSVS